MSHETPSDALLRTLAAVAPGTRIVEVGCGRGHHTRPLAALGFDMWACDADADAVNATRRVIDDALGAGEGHRRIAQAAPDALGYPDAYAGWVVVSALHGSDAEVVESLREARRVLVPGGWLWIEVEAREPEDLERWAEAADLAVAESPRQDTDRGVAVGVFRRVDGDVVG